MTLRRSPLVLLPVLAALAGCGGGGGGSSGNFADVPDYVPLSNRTADKTSNLKGFVINSEGAASEQFVQATGKLRHETGALEDFGINGQNVNDRDGDAGGEWSSGSVTITKDEGTFAGSYRYSGLYRVEGGTTEGPAIIGVVTAAGDVPRSGSATYRGDGFVAGVINGATAVDGLGQSRVDADFGTGRVDVTISSLDDPNVDTVTISDMSISGNGFSGGTIAIDGSTAPLGTGVTVDAQGAFYGQSGNQPAEAGGGFTANGSQGELFGGFLAKK